MNSKFFSIITFFSILNAEINISDKLHLDSVDLIIVSSKNKYYNIDLQGRVSDIEELNIKIPYKTYKDNIIIPSFFKKVKIDKKHIKNRTSNLYAVLQWDEQELKRSGHIKANIKVFNNRQKNELIQLSLLDEIELLKFDYHPYSSFTKKSYLTIRLVGSIKHKDFTEEKNKYIYLPIKSPKTNRVWLNHNLGSVYSHIDSSNFHPKKDTHHINDHFSFGKLYKWKENICPIGFRLPTKKELKEELDENILSKSFLKLTHAGMINDNEEHISFAGILGNYWVNSTMDNHRAEALRVFNKRLFWFHASKHDSFSVRCTKE